MNINKNIPLSELKKFAKPFISNYKVSAIARCDKKHFNGINFEVTPQYNIHAEQSAIHNAYVNDSTFDSIELEIPSCGYCRQLIHELNPNATISVAEDKYTIKELLPHMYEGDMSVYENKYGKFFGNSYSPFTNSPCRLFIDTKDGKEYEGIYIESVAFNMSVLPLLGAMSMMFMDGKELEDISKIRLDFLNDSKINHLAITYEILSHLNLFDVEVEPLYVNFVHN